MSMVLGKVTHIVCRKTCLLSCSSNASWRVTSPFGALFGPPTAFRRKGPSVPWASSPGPTGVMTHQGDEPPKRQPFVVVSCR